MRLQTCLPLVLMLAGAHLAEAQRVPTAGDAGPRVFIPLKDGGTIEGTLGQPVLALHAAERRVRLLTGPPQAPAGAGSGPVSGAICPGASVRWRLPASQTRPFAKCCSVLRSFTDFSSHQSACSRSRVTSTTT
jgi:hypothetical protein